MSKLQIAPLTKERWGDFVELFERRGSRGGHRNVPAYGCWCMYWRDRSLGHGTPKKRAMGSLVRSGKEPGLLAYEDDGPVGWVSVAPREQYEALLRSPQYRPQDDEEGVWSIVCFVVDRPRQRQGVAPELLEAALKHARRRKALALEAYPHRVKKDDYMGHVELFLEHGFEIVREASKRAVVRRRLR